MKSQKGITLTSLVVYITVVLVVLGILAVISGVLKGNINEIYAEGTNNAEIDKFNVYFLKEVKKQGNAIDTDKPSSTTEVYFTTGNKYTYNSNDKCIYLNDNIKIAENIEKCVFSTNLVNGKTVVTVAIKALNGEGKTIEYVLNNKEISFNYENENDYISINLPSDYKHIEYIESTGTQYIDTGIIPNQDTGFDILFLTKNRISTSYPEYGSILGARERSAVNELQLTTYKINAYAGTLRFATSGSYNAGITVNEKMHIILKNKVYTNSNVQYILDKEFQAPCSLTIFALNQNGTVIQNGKVQLYSLKLYDGDTLVRNYIPCYRVTDNVIGLYDLVENKFYINQGTGDFIAGI